MDGRWVPMNSRVNREAFQDVFELLNLMSRDPGPFGLLARPDVLSIIDLFDRAGEQLHDKQQALKTLKDYEGHQVDQDKFLAVLQRGLSRIPPGIQVPLFDHGGVKAFADDQVIRKTWVDWYKAKRARWEKSIRLTEDDIPIYPDFEITDIRGRYTNLRISSNIPVFELGYRIRQAFEYFWVLHNVYCSPNPAPPIGCKLPLGPRLLDPYSNPKPRVPSAEYLFDPNLTIRDACIKITELFVVSVVKLGHYPELLPAVAALDHELSPEHTINAVKELGID